MMNRLAIPEGNVLNTTSDCLETHRYRHEVAGYCGYTFVGDVTFYTGQVLIVHRTLCFDSDSVT